jgi:hypothetical protein
MTDADSTHPAHFDGGLGARAPPLAARNIIGNEHLSPATMGPAPKGLVDPYGTAAVTRYCAQL